MEYAANMTFHTVLLEITVGATECHPFWLCLLLGVLQGSCTLW